jgi:hypothetical protein
MRLLLRLGAVEDEDADAWEEEEAVGATSDVGEASAINLTFFASSAALSSAFLFRSAGASRSTAEMLDPDNTWWLVPRPRPRPRPPIPRPRSLPPRSPAPRPPRLATPLPPRPLKPLPPPSPRAPRVPIAVPRPPARPRPPNSAQAGTESIFMPR